MKSIVDYLASGVKPDVRLLWDMRDVLYNRNASVDAKRELYYMYRDLAASEQDRLLIGSAGLRYDITVVNPGLIGDEFVKTAGHYHPKIPGTDLTYTEVYQVLEGKAHYLLQKEYGSVLLEVFLVEAAEGDVVIIPPNYGHVTINPGAEKLVMANWVYRNFSSDYDPIKYRGGGAYFELSDGSLIKNERYQVLPRIRVVKPKDSGRLGLEKDADMYSLISDLGRLNFLKNPKEHMQVFKNLYY